MKKALAFALLVILASGCEPEGNTAGLESDFCNEVRKRAGLPGTTVTFK